MNLKPGWHEVIFKACAGMRCVMDMKLIWCQVGGLKWMCFCRGDYVYLGLRDVVEIRSIPPQECERRGLPV